ncbi:MAG: hypothetical protein IT438_11005 [Phycisphaerales bacterium]|nr:hypothetical protein [Phycisphaerales bacterium]
MFKLLTHFTVWLCVLAQGWFGCAGGGKTLCFCFEASASQHAARVCNHSGCRGHEPDSKLPMPIPVHEHDHDCAGDIPLSDCGRVASAGMDMKWTLVYCGELSPLAGGFAGVDGANAATRLHGNFGMIVAAGAVRASTGLGSTRLRI